MQILALDTSGEHCSVALTRADGVDVREAHAGQRHSELVLGMVDELLAARGIAVRELDGIAYGAGPGSFTGLRIACGLTQGLAFAAGLPVAGIVTLAAMAEASGAARVIACLDARLQEVYHAAYEKAGDGWRVVSAPGLYAPGAAPALHGDGWVGCGNGFEVFGEALARRYGQQIERVEPAVRPHAREIARLAQREFEQGRGLDAADAVPLYIRDKVALTMDER